MMPSSPRVVFASFALIFMLSVSLHSQDSGTSVARSKVEIEKIADRLAELDRDFEAKLNAVRQEVDAEVAAKTISEPLAASIRWSLRASAFSGGSVNARDILTTLRIPPDNAKLATAATALDETFTKNQKERTALLVSGTEEVRRRFETVVTSAETADAVLAVRRELDAVRLAFVSADARALDFENAIRETSVLLDSLEQMLRGVETGKPERMQEGMLRFRATLETQARGSGIAAGKARLERLAAPFNDALVAAEADLLKAFAAGQPEAELESALDRLAEAERRTTLISQNPFGGNSRTVPFRAVLTAMKSAATGDAGRFRAALQVASDALQTAPGPNAARLRAVLEKVERDSAATLATAREAKTSEFRKRLETAKGADDLEAIAADMRSSFSRQEGDAENWNALATELMTLAAHWAGGDIAGFESRSGYTGRLAPDLNALRERVDRDLLANGMRFPELFNLPLWNVPLPAAIESLSDQLAKKKEWRRLYDLLTRRIALPPHGAGIGGPDDTLAALRAFFAGQNLELAEQWTQAASAYQQVLQSASARAPIKDAADRLKEITRKHPEAGKSVGKARP